MNTREKRTFPGGGRFSRTPRVLGGQTLRRRNRRNDCIEQGSTFVGRRRPGAMQHTSLPLAAAPFDRAKPNRVPHAFFTGKNSAISHQPQATSHQPRTISHQPKLSYRIFFGMSLLRTSRMPKAEGVLRSSSNDPDARGRGLRHRWRSAAGNPRQPSPRPPPARRLRGPRACR